MSRYIDADALMDTLGISDEEIDFKEILREAPSVEAVEVVRCKECKHNYNTAINHGKMNPRCDFTDYKLTENDYCSRGERKESE